MPIKKFYVSIFNSKKGNKTFAVVCDLGYTKKYLSFDVSVISELMAKCVSEIYDLPCGDYDLNIGE